MSLAEADLDLTNMAMGGAPQRTAPDILQQLGFGNTYEQPVVLDPGDAALYVRFFLYPRLNEQESVAEGRPIYYDAEFIEIIQPGNKESVISRPASVRDKGRFARQYQAFKTSNPSEGNVGTPLEHWAALTRSEVEELKYFNCHTVDQLAVMADGVTAKFMGLARLKVRAKAYLESTGKSAEGEKLASRLENTENELGTLRTQIKDLSEQLAAERAAKKK